MIKLFDFKCTKSLNSYTMSLPKFPILSPVLSFDVTFLQKDTRKMTITYYWSIIDFYKYRVSWDREKLTYINKSLWNLQSWCILRKLCSQEKMLKTNFSMFLKGTFLKVHFFIVTFFNLNFVQNFVWYEQKESEFFKSYIRATT